MNRYYLGKDRFCFGINTYYPFHLRILSEKINIGKFSSPQRTRTAMTSGEIMAALTVLPV